MKNYGDASAFIDYKNFATDGYLTNAHLRRGNLFVKFVKPDLRQYRADAS